MSTKKSISRIFSVLFVIGFTFSVIPLQAAYASGIRYATPGGTGDCSSWANACTLQTALTGVAIGDEIWVAAGTYKPTAGTDRSSTFQLKNSVALYGGFAGTETEREQRNPEVNITILSGDIDNNDSQTPIITDLTTVTGNTTNSRHVVSGTSVSYAVVETLDGFTITAGYASGTSSCPWACGGGMLNPSGSSPTLANVTFSGNSATWGGGMANLSNSKPTLTNVTFSGNSASSNGGGIYNRSSDPTLTDVTFSGNSAYYGGGGMYNTESSSPALTNVTFGGNSALSGSGGGMHNNSSSPALTNVTFSGNSAFEGRGGGMYNGSSSPMLTNITFSGNTAGDRGGGMYNYSSSPTIRNSIFWGNTIGQIYNGSGSTPSLLNNVVQGGCPVGSLCIFTFTTDPRLGPLGDNGGFTQTIPLLVGSSAIDTGNDAVCPATDQRGVSRPQDAHCDIGAFELKIYWIYLPLILR